MYTRENANVFFLIPTIAVGTETDGRFFLEIAWLCWAVGVGEA